MKMINRRNIAYSTFIAILAVFMALPVMTFAGTIQLPQTGQTKCYGTNGAPIACDGTGQDGEIQAGVVWPSPRFVDHGDGTVTDKLTGLIWTKDANLMATRDPAWDTDGNFGDGLVKWQHALNYVAKLNSDSYLGHTDWRLPNVEELRSLVDYSQYNPSLPQGYPFTNVHYQSDDRYWSSTTIANRTGYAWFVNFTSGYVHQDMAYKVGVYYAWPVRGGQCGPLGDSFICLPKTGQTKCYDSSGAEISCAGTGQDGEIQAGVVWPSPRFVDHGDGTVTDKLTGLEWQQDTAAMPDTWEGALAYCESLNLGGHSDWRLPNVQELRSLIDYSNLSLPQGHPFTNLQPTGYWSSITGVGFPSYTWYVDFKYGNVDLFPKSSYGLLFVRAVRGGQVGPVTTTTTIPGGTTTTTISNGTTTTIPGGTTTTTICSGPCCVNAIYGENAEQTQLLRKYRDNVLSKTPEGQEIIKVYCAFSPKIVSLLEKNPLLKNKAKAFIDSMLPGIRKKVEESKREP